MIHETSDIFLKIWQKREGDTCYPQCRAILFAIFIRQVISGDDTDSLSLKIFYFILTALLNLSRVGHLEKWLFIEEFCVIIKT